MCWINGCMVISNPVISLVPYKILAYCFPEFAPSSRYFFMELTKNYNAQNGTSMSDSSHSATVENKPFRFIIPN